MIGEDDEVACFQRMAEMIYGLIYGQQLAVVSAVYLLGWVECLEEESERQPGVLDVLLKYGTHGGRGGDFD